jgi:ADP-ribosylation factor-like protein 1
MGKELSKLTQKVCLKSTMYKVVILGLEGAGKTSLFDRIKSNEVYIRHPTIGFIVEQIKLDGIQMTLWDFGGNEKIMNLWDRYIDGTDLVILVIDSSDYENLDRVKAIFEIIKQKLPDVYVLIVLNKVDLNQSLSNDVIVKKTDLYNNDLKIANVVRTSMSRGDGIKELLKAIKNILIYK